MSTRPHVSLLAPSLLAIALVAACSGTDATIPAGYLTQTDGGSKTATHTPTPVTTATTSPAPSASSRPADAGTDAAAPKPAPVADAAPPSPPVSTVPTWTSQPTTSPGCGKAATSSPVDGDTGSVTVNGVTRTYVYYVPPSYDPTRAYPLVTLFHGIQATGEEMAQYIQMQIYSAGNAITAFPDGANGGYWDITGDSDLQFMDALSAKLEGQLCINEQRTFALGFSLGAYMANHFACHRPTLRAFVAADGGYPDSAACAAPVAALIYHRNEDDNEPVANGINAKNHWITNDSCGASSVPFNADGLMGPTTDPTALLGPAGCVSYTGCASSTAPVIWCDDMYTSATSYKHDLRIVYRVPIWNWFDAF